MYACLFVCVCVRAHVRTTLYPAPPCSLRVLARSGEWSAHVWARARKHTHAHTNTKPLTQPFSCHIFAQHSHTYTHTHRHHILTLAQEAKSSMASASCSSLIASHSTHTHIHTHMHAHSHTHASYSYLSPGSKAINGVRITQLPHSFTQHSHTHTHTHARTHTHMHHIRTLAQEAKPSMASASRSSLIASHSDNTSESSSPRNFKSTSPPFIDLATCLHSSGSRLVACSIR
jgi:hypothetical protein